MSDVCIVCGTFDDRCNCFAGGDSAGFPSSDVVAPSEAPTVTPPPGPVGATISVEASGCKPMDQTAPGAPDLASAPSATPFDSGPSTEPPTAGVSQPAPAVGASIVGESGYPVAQTPRPSYSDMADAVMFCAHFLMLREARARKADPNPQTVRMLDRWAETAALALHAADVLRGLGEGAL